MSSRASVLLCLALSACAVEAPVETDVASLHAAPGSAAARRVVSVAANAYHSCAVNSAGDARCWGYNGYGELGDGTTSTRASPAAVIGLPGKAIAVAAGLFHSCALLANGDVWCWGSGAYGQLGLGSTASSVTPQRVLNLPPALQLVAGANHTCALVEGGRAWCWGDNAAGQLGDGTTAGRTSPVPGLVAGAVQLAAGAWHSCALTAQGRVACWGRNYAGQVGDGSTSDRASPVVVGGVVDAKDVSAGAGHTCALTAAGAVRCWGDNSYGQFGNGTVTSSLVSVQTVANGTRALALGAYHSCVVSSTGRLRCAGANTAGALGNGTAAASTTFVNAQANVLSAASGSWHTCAARSDGALTCTGYNAYGQLGDGSTAQRLAMTAVPGVTLTRARSIATGAWHTCATHATGSVHCFGSNAWGQLGLALTTTGTPVPTASYAVGGDVVEVAASAVTTCVLRVTGAVECFGRGDFGELGTGIITRRATPAPIALPRPAVAVGGGEEHLCALLDDGRVACWGQNTYGSLGNGTTADAATPVLVTNTSGATLTRAVDLALNTGVHACARRGDGAVSCWGGNGAGQTGVTTTSGAVTRAATLPGLTVGALSAGRSHTCGVRSDGVTVCWGENEFGALATGYYSAGFAPSPVASLHDSAGASSGGNQLHCAVTARGRVRCSGYGALGMRSSMNDLAPAYSPVDFSGDGAASSIRAGWYQVCHSAPDGALWCWGRNDFGQLGRGSAGGWFASAAATAAPVWVP